ncbi:allantoicase [Gordonia bronchialis DSM 43247]|uniref:Probable allantoicase n=2 Tax=Gordonia bronchialis TaxID=2054 RepID=D0L4H1_GORB4|nr:allantoicase [Gordonia bronchialis DSM 43247]QGS23403.1 allantoicase [Gordonia bronchialis]STQ66160.1 allantoicase [Gordonia bronchialis]
MTPQPPPVATGTRPHFTSMPDLALRDLGGAVVWTSDELFAESQNLIKTSPAQYQPATFGHKGQVYDGWETRRRRGAGVDQAIVRLGAPGVVYGVVVDTSWFKGNYPPFISVEATAVEGVVSAEELVSDAEWVTIVEKSPAEGDTRNPFTVDATNRFTHVRLTMYPDGGVARFRVHGRGVPDPHFFRYGHFDLAALENGGLITACSNMFYSSPNNLLMPGRARNMGEGWETSRRRDDGNDWVQVRLAGQGRVSLVELDTSYFLGNAPGAATVRGRDGDGDWFEVLPRTDLQPDTRHRFVIDLDRPMTEARLDIYPDGGMARLKLYGTLTEEAESRLIEQWERGEA